MENPNAQNVTWNLSDLYTDIEDPRIGQDLAVLEKLARQFSQTHKGRLAEDLGRAIADYIAIKTLADKISVYIFLRQSQNVADEKVKQVMARAQQKISSISGQYLTFFILELVALDEVAIEKLCEQDVVVKKHKPWILHQRVFRDHVLSEPIESALQKRSMFGADSWAEFFDECEADLRFTFEGPFDSFGSAQDRSAQGKPFDKTQDRQKTLTEMLDVLHDIDRQKRADALKIINDGFAGAFAKYSAQALHMVVASHALERKERNYRHPMQAQNKSNNVPDEVVEALHAAVKNVAAPLAQKYYRLKAKMLGVDRLAWSDRNAPLAAAQSHGIPFAKAMDMVLTAYQSFSPTLAGIVRDFAKQGSIDAPATPGKRGGAFNYSIVLPDGTPRSFTMLNYLGSGRDVMTLAHELGHGVHGILAGQAQGALMAHAPIAYCETASVFGEMITFDYFTQSFSGSRQERLSMLCQKIEDMLNTVVRQVAFSNFERRIHGMDEQYVSWQEPKKLSAQELSNIWLATTQEFYGAPGDVFDYHDCEYLWSYVSHFHRPFYVYGYAFGELLTQSLYAVRDSYGVEFEKLYLDLLRSGSTKNATELLAPFGLNPASPTFWEEGIRVGLGNMIDQVEELLLLHV